MKLKATLIMGIYAILSVTTVDAATWNTSGDWVTKGGNKFFAIGLWPDPDEIDHYTETATEFEDFSVFVVNKKSELADYMDAGGQTIMIGASQFRWRFSDGFIDTYEYNGTDLTDYYNPDSDDKIEKGEMDDLAPDYWRDVVKEYIEEKIVGELRSELDGHSIGDYIIYIADEPERMKKGWFIEEPLLNKYLDKVDEASAYNDIGALTLGPIEGSHYFWDDAAREDCDGSTVPDTGATTAAYFKNNDCSAYSSTDRSEGLQNIKDLVSYYKDATNIWMVNSYSAMLNDPAWAADIPTAIKEELETPYQEPVWMWFNANQMTDTITRDKVRCQIFTAITAQTTGIFFYALGASETSLTYAKGIADDLDDFLPVWSNFHSSGYADAVEIDGTTECGFQYHYAIFDDGTDDYLLLTNTTGDGSCYVDEGDISFESLWPNNVGSWDVELWKEGDNGPSIKPAATQVPEGYAISIAPNPFNPSTSIQYTIPENQQVSIDIHNSAGQKVRNLVDEYRIAGTYSVVFDGSGLGSGMYLYTIKAGQFVESGRLTLLK